MSKKPVPIVAEQAPQSVSGKRYSDDFKRDAVRLVTEERYSFRAAATAVGVFILGEPFTAIHALAMAMAATGVVLITSAPPSMPG